MSQKDYPEDSNSIFSNENPVLDSEQNEERIDFTIKRFDIMITWY